MWSLGPLSELMAGRWDKHWMTSPGASLCSHTLTSVHQLILVQISVDVLDQSHSIAGWGGGNPEKWKVLSRAYKLICHVSAYGEPALCSAFFWVLCPRQYRT